MFRLPFERPSRRKVVLLGVGAFAFGWVVTGLVGRTGVFDGDPMFKAVEAGRLLPAADAAPRRRSEPPAIAGQRAGLELVALGEVERVRTGKGWRLPYEGSRLIAFTIADGPCEDEPCKSWRTLRPSVVLDGRTKRLPSKGATFALLVPPGAEQADLRVQAGGYVQTLSLLDGEPGQDNITVLRRTASQRHASVHATFSLAETTSIGLADGSGPGRNEYVRDVVVSGADLRFFLEGRTPRHSRDAFLVLDASYSYGGKPNRYLVAPTDVAFLDEDGNRHPGIDLDPAEDKTLVGFEVPGSLERGTLVFGGTSSRVSTTGTPYRATLQTRRVPIRFGD